MHEFPVLEWNGLHFDVASIIAIVVSMIITLALAIAATRKLSVENPSKLQNFMEWVVEFVHNIIAGSMPLKRVKPFLSLGLTLILFIFISNMLGLPFGIVTEVEEPMPQIGVTEQMITDAHAKGAEGVEVAWWKSPTADLSVTAGLALITFVLVHFLGVKLNGKHYFKHYLEPYPVFLPITIIEELAKPLTLALRLFANIFAGEILLTVILMLGVVGIPFLIAWQGFSIFIGAIQAYLFTVLTMVYIAKTTVHEEEEH
jgi:F-type H+-transporting ATPase subunit a